jgi:predicted permease
MSWLRGWWEVIRAVFRRGSVERDLAEELRFHMEHQVEANVAAGMARDEARSAALRKFGGVDRWAEETRDARGVRWLDDLRTDARYAWRGMRRMPGAAAVAVLTLTLGIGSTVSIFSVVNGVLLKPLPYAEPDRLVSVWGRFLPISGFDFAQFPLSGPEYFDLAEQGTFLKSVGAYNSTGATLVSDDGQPHRVRAASVTAEVFDILGVRPELGRGFTQEEAAPGGEPVVVISHGLWQSSFGGDPGVVGRTLRMNGTERSIVGVMPRGFSFPGEGVQLWQALRLDAANPGGRSSHGLRSIARLAPGITQVQADASMRTLMARWEADFPDVHTGHFLFLRSLSEDIVGDVRLPLLVVLAAVAIVLLLVCVNVAHVLLARSLTRRRELAVRVALGAQRRRIVQQTLMEGLLLAVGGTVLGLLAARAAMGPLLGLATGSVPRTTNVQIDATVALFAAVLCILVAMLSALLPAIVASRADPQSALREEGRSATSGRRAGRVRGALVSAEVALATVVVVAAALLGRSFAGLTAVDPGFDAENVLVVDLTLSAGDVETGDQVLGFYVRLRDALAALPGVRAASGTSSLPLLETPGNTDFVIEGRPAPAPGEPATSGDLIVAMPDLPEALGIRMLEGRFFNEADDTGAPLVAVVNRTLARMFFDGDALGRRIRIASSDFPWLTIVGIIDDVRFSSVDAPERPGYYMPLAQFTQTFSNPPLGMTMALRTDGDPFLVADAARSALRELNAGVPIMRLDRLTRIVRDSFGRQIFTLSIVSAFALLALVLGALGLYGLLSVNVAERTRELGIRMALGANRLTVARIVLVQGLALTAIGLLFGFLAAAVAGRFLASLLFAIEPTDIVTYGGVAAVLIAVALVACLVPVARVLRLDPVNVLRG